MIPELAQVLRSPSKRALIAIASVSGANSSGPYPLQIGVLAFAVDVADNEHRDWNLLGPPLGQITIFFDSATKSFNHQTS